MEQLTEGRNCWTCALEPESRNYWVHVLQLLKPGHPRACALQQEKPPQQETPAPQLEGSPCLLQLEKARAATKTQHSQK